MLLSISAQHGFAAQRVSVFVSILPQKYFVQQIGKDLVDVRVMAQPGASPATYEPKAKQMADLSKTQLYFAIGAPFENAWLEKIAAANPKMNIIHTDQGIEKIPMATHHHHHAEAQTRNLDGELHNEGEHNHEQGEDPDGAQHHTAEANNQGTLDPHIWLSPPLVMAQARSILNGLQQIDPPHHAVYAANYGAFISRIEELDLALNNIFSGRKGLEFMVFHPSWGYFAQAYGLFQVPIEFEGKDPKPAQLKELIKHAREKGINVIFAQPQFSTRSAELVAREIGGQVVLADPLAEDWLANLQEVAERFKAALR